MPDRSDRYRTLAGELRHAPDPIKGSRFLGCAAPATSLERVRAYVAAIRTEHPRATHHCWGARLGAVSEGLRFDDDGEPTGSAGRPIAQQIEGHGLHDVVVVVVRWFGGTKLGVGGLMRAYSGCAGQTLDRAPVREVLRTRSVVLRHPYDCSGALTAVLAAHGLEPLAADYGAEVVLRLEVPLARFEAFEREVRERTAGRAVLDQPSST